MTVTARKTPRQKRATARTRSLQKQADVLALLAGESKRARKMSAVEPFVAVPTVFTSLNRATMVGGAPLSCVWIIHGPSGDGKTAMTIALIISVLNAGGMAAFVDAEQAADIHRWFRFLGLPIDRVLYIGRTDPKEDTPPLTHEEVVDECDALIERFKKGKREGKIAPGTPLIVVVDSISKMVPASLLAKLRKDGAKALSGGVGRLQAMLNRGWLAELGTKVGNDDILFAIIAHEMESDSSNSWTADYKVRGGGALQYDTMMKARVTFASQVKDYADSASGTKHPMVGKRHRIQILKNKHGTSHKVANFYTSNGDGICPPGFDRVREIVHEGILRGMVEGPTPKKGESLKLTLGSRLVWNKHKMTLKQLYDPKLAPWLAEIEAALNEDAMPEEIE